MLTLSVVDKEQRLKALRKYNTIQLNVMDDRYSQASATISDLITIRKYETILQNIMVYKLLLEKFLLKIMSK